MGNEQLATLSVQLRNTEFRQEANYFILVSLRGPKGLANVLPQRTEVSSPSKRPNFQKNTFTFDVPSTILSAKRQQGFRWLKSADDKPIELVCTACRTRHETSAVEVVGDVIISAASLTDKLLTGELHTAVYGFVSRLDEDEPMGQVEVRIKLDSKPLDLGDGVTAGTSSSSLPRRANSRRTSKPGRDYEELETLVDEQLPGLPAKLSSKAKQRDDQPLPPPPVRVAQHLVIIIHEAWQVPSSIDPTTGRKVLPRPFVLVKTTQRGPKQKAGTHFAAPCREVMFGETLTLDLSDPLGPHESFDIIFTLADSSTKRIYSRAFLPVSLAWLPSHRQVTLTLAVGTENGRAAPHMRVSITRLDMGIGNPKDLQKDYSQQVIILGGILRGFTRSLPTACKTYALIRIARDANQRSEETARRPAQSHLKLDFDPDGQLLGPPIERRLSIPNLVYLNPPVSTRSQLPNYVLTASSEMTDRPSWNFPFVLVASPEDLQDGAFLIVELYRETAALPISYDPNADDYEGRQQEPSSRHTMIATASVPLITLFRNKVDGQMIALDDVALTFASLYAKHPATRDHTLRLSLEVPEFWGLVDPAHDVFQTMREPHPSSSIPRQSAQPMLSMAEARLPPVRDNFGSAANPSSRYLTPPRDGLTSADWNSKPRRFSPQPYAQPSHQQRPLDDSYNQPQVDYSQPQDQSPFGAQQDLFPISNENVKSSSLLRKDIEQRQVLIDRLTRELDRRTEAVKRVGQELLNLRDLNARLENKNQTLHRRLEDADIKTARLMSTADIDVLSLDEIRRRYVLLVYKLDKAMKTNTGLVKEIEGLQDVDFEKTALEDRFLELRQAHTAQQSILQKMQAKLDKFAKSRQTIERQEQVISKLEGIFQEMTRKEVLEPHNPIEHFIRAVCREGAIYDHALAKIVTEENSKLTSQLAELNVQVAGLQSENDNLKEELAKNAWEGEDARRRFEEAAAQRYEEYNWKARYQTAVTRAERAEGKIQALEDELAQNAQSFAQQMSQLRRYAAETTTALNNVKAVNAQYREQYSPSPILTPEPTPAPVNEDQRPGVGKAKAAPVAQNAPGRKKK